MKKTRHTYVHRLLFAVLILAIAGTATGCVYLRLLKLKGQLRRFERYVRFDESNGLTILLNEPILLEKDIVWLLEGEAAIQARNGRYTLLKYDFEKLVQGAAPKSAGGVPIALNLHFEDGKLYKLRFPREFSKYLQPALLQGSLESMGKGSVDKQNKSVSATMQTDAHPDRETQVPIIPTKSDIKSTLGPPSLLTETAAGDILYYQYSIQVKQKEEAGQLPTLQMWLRFSPEDEKLRVAKASFHGMTTAIAFQ